jgi:formylglycine-generating enzyme required for sulfatase activity
MRTVAAVMRVCAALASSGCGLALGLDDLVADRIDGMVNAGSFNIDAHEVTNGEYRAFLDSAPSLSGQHAACGLNDSYVPGEMSQAALALAMERGVQLEVDPSCPGWFDAPHAGGDNHPVGCIDWCDAVAYCAWRGKRLCGKLGGGELVILQMDPEIIPPLEQSEWHHACSAGSTRTFPYGNDYTAGICNDREFGTEEASAHPECEGGFDGILDMSGNVEEFHDSCEQFDPPELQNCLRAGGAWWSPGDMTCDTQRPATRPGQSPSTGFRCCADVVTH